jgi:hypothetical protein
MPGASRLIHPLLHPAGRKPVSPGFGSGLFPKRPRWPLRKEQEPTTMINHRTVPPHTHTGHKSHKQIKAQCKALGLTFRDTLWQEDRSDHVIVEGGGARVYYNTFNGCFFGTTDLGVEFSCETSAYDAEPWFQTLLDFFLEGRKEGVPS